MSHRSSKPDLRDRDEVAEQKSLQTLADYQQRVAFLENQLEQSEGRVRSLQAVIDWIGKQIDQGVIQ